jgi:hypothetical protein
VNVKEEENVRGAVGEDVADVGSSVLHVGRLGAHDQWE